MVNRHALIIGVPSYLDAGFRDERLAAAVTSDIAAMRDALSHSGFDITERGIADSEQGGATLNRINQAIEEACAAAPAGGVLLIYFSGHGVTIDGHDYLVPSDAYRAAGGTPVLRSLTPLVPDVAVLASCRARLVVFFADACRNDPSEGDPAAVGPAVEPGGQQPFLADDGQFVLVMGCGNGQKCHFDETGSTFTQALAQVLDHRHPARTLTDVIDTTTAEVLRRSRQFPDSVQEPVVRNRAVLDRAGDVVICEGDELAAAWRKAVAASPLLARCADQEQVQAVVAECARRCGGALDALRDRTGLSDPWSDQNYPGRVLKHTELLLEYAGLTALRSGEAAMLIVAPFLREAVLAEGLREAAGIDPANLTRTYRHGPRSDLELTHEMHQHLVQRATGLAQRARAGAGDERASGSEAGAAGTASPSDQLAMWLVHQWLAGRVKLWEEPAQDVYKLAMPLLADCRGTAGEQELPKLVQALLLSVGAHPADGRLGQKLDNRYVDNRWRGFAAVLWLSGILGADLRRLPPVVADLVGTGMELPLGDVQDAVGRRSSWQPGDQTDPALDLHLVCDHPALHDVFEDIARRANMAAEKIAALARKHALAMRLPTRFTTENLRPSTKPDDEPAYKVPLARFQIAEEKVRELLMGKQLYGEPELAIRELYQNALDACRWRAARQEYLMRTGLAPSPWAGEIRFRQDVDELGRPFIECTDNGVGMDMDTLEHVFANAGERFVYRQSFRAEQAEWEGQDPPIRMVSNSQFGIGVFSYFMLADEITVLTRHQRSDGVVSGDAYEVRIASSGSLIQINGAQGMPGGGTRIRLYLAGDTADISVLRTLRDLLWIAEHRVEVHEGDGHETWLPDDLRYQEDTAAPLRYGKYLWWVSGDGCLAADGIKTSEEVFGLVVNLRDERRPQFTVDRKTLRAIDEDWVRREIRDSLPQLMEWPGFTLAWLWKVAKSAPKFAQEIFDYSVTVDHSIKIGAPWGHGRPVSISQAGCFPDDAELFDAGNWNRFFAIWFLAWRSGTWRQLIASPVKVRLPASAESVTGLPVPDPIDSELISRLNAVNNDGQITLDKLLLALAHPEQKAADRLRRLRRYAITGINLSMLKHVPPIDATFKEEDTELIRAFAAWTPAGAPPELSFAGPLIKTSLELDRPLGEVLRRAGELGPSGWIPPAVNLEELSGYTCTSADAALLSLRTTGNPPWVRGELLPCHLAAVSDSLGRPLNEILERCDRFAPLGVKVASRSAYPENITTEEIESLRLISSPGQSLSLLHLVLVAGRSGVSLGEAYRNLERLEERGMLTRPPFEEFEEFVPSVWHVGLIEEELTSFDYRQPNYRDLMEKPCIGIASLTAGSARNANYASSFIDLIPFTFPSVPITCTDLVQLACSTRGTLGEARAKILELYPEAKVPDLSRNCADLSVSWEVSTALMGYRSRYQSAPKTIGPGDIAGGALAARRPLGDYLDMLAPFRELMIPVPSLNESTRNTLNQIILDDYHLQLLDCFDEFSSIAYLGLRKYLTRVTALDLVRAAGRLGMSLARAHQRLSDLIPLGLILDYPDVDIPDEIVRWQDLLILTVHLDGQAPALSGDVGWQYLYEAAEEIFGAVGEDIRLHAAWLRDRLTLYAPLFNLKLPEKDADA